MDIENLKQNMKDGFTARSRDPLLGSYLTSFIIYNWKLWLILSYPISLDDKLLRIEKVLFPMSFNIIHYHDDFFKALWNDIPFAFITPFIYALIYLFFYQRYIRNILKEASDNRIRIENDRIESLKNYKPINEVISSLKKEIQTLEEDRKTKEILIEQQKESLNLARNNSNEMQNQIEKLTKISDQWQERYLEETRNKTNHNIAELLDIHEQDEFKKFAEIISSRNIMTSGNALQPYIKLTTKLSALRVIEKVRKGNIDVWQLTEAGKDLFLKIATVNLNSR